MGFEVESFLSVAHFQFSVNHNRPTKSRRSEEAGDKCDKSRKLFLFLNKNVNKSVKGSLRE